MAWSYHHLVSSGKIWQAVCQATDREEGGCVLPDDQSTKTGHPVAEVLREKHPDSVSTSGEPSVRSLRELWGSTQNGTP